MAATSLWRQLHRSVNGASIFHHRTATAATHTKTTMVYRRNIVRVLTKGLTEVNRVRGKAAREPDILLSPFGPDANFAACAHVGSHRHTTAEPIAGIAIADQCCRLYETASAPARAAARMDRRQGGRINDRCRRLQTNQRTSRLSQR